MDLLKMGTEMKKSLIMRDQIEINPKFIGVKLCGMHQARKGDSF